LIAVTTEALVKDDGAIEALQELQEKLVAVNTKHKWMNEKY
jgi:hypothetical protein